MRFFSLACLLCAGCGVGPEDTASAPRAVEPTRMETVLTTTIAEGPAGIDPTDPELHVRDGGPAPGTPYPPSLSPDGSRVAMCQLPAGAAEASKRDAPAGHRGGWGFGSGGRRSCS